MMLRSLQSLGRLAIENVATLGRAGIFLRPPIYSASPGGYASDGEAALS